jgi:hypothetical protein
MMPLEDSVAPETVATPFVPLAFDRGDNAGFSALPDHRGFFLFENLNGGDLAGLNGHLNLNGTRLALAFTRVGAVLVSSVGTSGEESGSGENDQFLHGVFFLLMGDMSRRW